MIPIWPNQSQGILDMRGGFEFIIRNTTSSLAVANSFIHEDFPLKNISPKTSKVPKDSDSTKGPPSEYPHIISYRDSSFVTSIVTVNGEVSIAEQFSLVSLFLRGIPAGIEFLLLPK